MHAARAKTAFDRGRGLVDGCRVAGQWLAVDTAYAKQVAIICNYASVTCIVILRQNIDLD